MTEAELIEHWHPVLVMESKVLSRRVFYAVGADDLYQYGAIKILKMARNGTPITKVAIYRGMVDAVRLELGDGRRTRRSRRLDVELTQAVRNGLSIYPLGALEARIDVERLLNRSLAGSIVYRNAVMGDSHREIGESMGVTGGRVWQISQEYVNSLRAAL